MRENRSLCQVTKSEKHAWNTIRIVIFQHLKSLLVVGDPKFLWRWLGEIWQSHGTFSIGLAWFRFTEDNSTKESVDFARGSTLVPYPGLDPRVLIKSFLGVKIDVVYPMTQEECKGHTRSARIELSSRAERHFKTRAHLWRISAVSTPLLWRDQFFQVLVKRPSLVVSTSSPKFYLKVWRIQLCVLWMWDVTRWPIVPMSDLSLVIRSSSPPKS